MSDQETFGCLTLGMNNEAGQVPLWRRLWLSSKAEGSACLSAHPSPGIKGG